MHRSTRKLKPILHRLYAARNDLRKLFPDLKFTLDGNLVGDIGEAIAIQDFGFTPLPPGTEGHDFKAPDGRLVQVKTTQAIQAGRAVGLGLTKQTFEHLLVIQLTEAGDYRILYDGPGGPVDAARAHKSSAYLTVGQLQKLNETISESDRLAITSTTPH